MGDGAYSVVEDQVYTVSCQANGNPAPVVAITDSNGEQITVSFEFKFIFKNISFHEFKNQYKFQNGGEIYAVRAVGDNIQKISCAANNNEEGFMEQTAAEEEAELDVYCEYKYFWPQSGCFFIKTHIYMIIRNDWALIHKF